jgi:hypothetical protein
LDGERVEEMINAIKKINKALRIVFAGVIVLYGIVKIFDVVPKERKERTGSSEERKTSEFDELW